MLKTILMKTKLEKQDGFTLIEVLMAMVVGTIGLLAIALMQGVAIEGNTSGNKFTQATFVAQDMLENIKDGAGGLATFGAIDMTASPAGFQLNAGAPVNVDENGNAGGEFTRSWTVESHTEWSRRITVVVTWIDVSNAIRDENGVLLNNPTRTVTLTSVSRGDGN